LTIFIDNDYVTNCAYLGAYVLTMLKNGAFIIDSAYFKCLYVELMFTKGVYVVLTLFTQGFYVPRVLIKGVYAINNAYLKCPMNVMFNILRKEQCWT
jgi:hypothetical protein